MEDFKIFATQNHDTLDLLSEAEKFNNYIFSLYAHHLRGDVFEFGAGIGNTSRMILKAGHSLTVSDIDASNVAQLQKIQAVNFHGALQIDIENFEKQKNLFDTVLSSNVLEHVKDDRAALANKISLLRSGGRVISLVPAIPALFGSLDQNLGHFRRYSKRQFELLHQNLGLKMLEIRYCNALSIPAWFLFGRILQKNQINSTSVYFANALTTINRQLDKLLKQQIGLSLIAIAEK